MRKILLTAALIGSAATLAACSGTEDAGDAASADAMTASEAEAAAADEVSGVLDANSATAEQLAGVEGVSAELAGAIAAGQPYSSVTDLNAKLLETLSADEAAAVLVNVFVPVNLNNASRDELNLIPGMNDKMAHEFEEYRPYEDMSEFDREIGKYVDEEEVARFRNYVSL